MTVRHPKVAVLLAAFNGMQWIEEQLASILNQYAVDVTVYISVDPSSDGTEAWCESYAARHESVSVLPSAGVFGGASRNFFRLLRDVDLDAYEFVAFADQDDVWHLDKLQRATHVIQTHDVDAYSSNVIAFWSSGRTQLLDKAQPQVEWDYLFEAAGPGCTYVMSRNMVASLKASMSVNWVDLQNVSLHDWYCYAFARSRNLKWFIDSRPSLQYRQHERNQVGANTSLYSLIGRYKTIHEGWWFSQVQLIARLIGKHTDPFVQRWLLLGRPQLLRLSLSAWKCRRRKRDRMLFFLICWITALLGNKSR